jgi:hypothetical protein
MANLNITLPEDFHAEIIDVAKQLKQTPEQCVLLALSHFFQTATVDNAIEGMDRTEDGQTLADFPVLTEELGIEIKFHPLALKELESLEEDDQIEVLEELITRISTPEEELEDTLDLVIKDSEETQVVLSGFEFGEILYKIGQNVIIYHIALIEDDLDEDMADVEEFNLEEFAELEEDDLKLAKSDN